jgi:tetratricopeptide (TPR) repeat protein
LSVLSLVGLGYFWIISFIYTSTSIALPYLFVFTALFAAVLTVGRAWPSFHFDLYGNSRNYFVSLLVLVLVLILVISSGYVLVQRFWSILVYQRAVASWNSGDLTEASAGLIKAVSLNGNDPLYYRTLANVKVQELNNLLSSISEGNLEESRPLLQNNIMAAIASAQEAVALNPVDEANHFLLGSVYEYLSGLQVEGAYEQALAVYQTLRENNPNNPRVPLALAQLEISQGRFEPASAYLEEALAIKSNFGSPILLLAQIDLEQTGRAAAIRRLEAAVQTVTADPSLYFQLGFLRYQAGDYDGAVSALERVSALSPGGINANAAYFLGLAYAASGERQAALEQFEMIESFNPDNQEVKTIISNIRSGRPALAGLTAAAVDEEATEESEPTEVDEAAAVSEEEN